MADSNTLDLHSLRAAQPTPPPTEPAPAETPIVPPINEPAPTLARPGLLRGATLFERQPDDANHPKAAAIARQRIADLPATHPLTHPDAVPALPTASLITNKNTLAGRDDMKPSVTRRKLPSVVVPIVTALSIFLLVLLLFKAPVLISQLNYSFSGNKTPATPVVNSSGTIPAENTLTIGKINVHAPIQFISSVVEADFQVALQDGVVHYRTTALPGQNGNVAIFGHSSNDWWEPGNYKFVFVLLDKLVPGDQITLDYNSVRYTYEVTGSKIVEPTAVDVLNPTATPTLTLITCTPAGTSLKRLVVTAKQVSPNPAGATAAATSTDSAAKASGDTLASSAPSFFDKIGDAWKNLTGQK